jgi:hypothetical protein
VQRLGAALPDDVQVRLPHIRADELNLRGEGVANDGEEAVKGSNVTEFRIPEHRRLPSSPIECHGAFLCLLNTRHRVYVYLHDHEGHTKLSDDAVAYLRSTLTAHSCSVQDD